MPGDSVDVYIAVAGVVKLFEPNVKVLTTPTFPGPAGGGNLIVRIETAEAAKWAYAADNTAVLVRPPARGRRQAHQAVDGNRVYGAEVGEGDN